MLSLWLSFLRGLLPRTAGFQHCELSSLTLQLLPRNTGESVAGSDLTELKYPIPTFAYEYSEPGSSGLDKVWPQGRARQGRAGSLKS